MHIKIKRKNLTTFIAVSKMSPMKTIPILNKIKLETKSDQQSVRIVVTDLDLYIAQIIECQVLNEGSCLIDYFLLKKICTATDAEDIEIEVTAMGTVVDYTKNLQYEYSREVAVRTGETEFKFQTQDIRQFAEEPQTKGIETIVPVSVFWEGIKYTRPFLSKEQSRFTLAAILIQITKQNSVRFASTDGHRLSFLEKTLETPLEAQDDILFPHFAADAIQRIRPVDKVVRILRTESRICLLFDNWEIDSRMLTGKFPNYDSVIPQKPNVSFRVKKESFRKAARAVEAAIDDREAVNCILSDTSIELHTSSDETTAKTKVETVSANFNKPVFIPFNPQYLQEYLKLNFSEQIEIKMCLKDLNGSVDIGAVLIEPFRENKLVNESEWIFSHVLMPLRSQGFEKYFQAEYSDGVWQGKSLEWGEAAKWDFQK